MTLRKQYSPSDKVVISLEAFAKLREEAEREYPREACGILLGEGEELAIKDIWSLANLARGMEARWRFQVDPLEYYRLELRAEKEGKRLLGFYHSHPDAPAEVSQEDEEFFIEGMLYLILSVRQNKMENLGFYRKVTSGKRAEKIDFYFEEGAV